MLKTNKAITLITLIITIIVLLILAGVTINMALGENGLFNKAKTSVAKYENAQDKENSILLGYENQIDSTREKIDVNIEDYNRLVNELNELRKNQVTINEFTGDFYLTGTKDYNSERMQSSYFEINVENYKKLAINISYIYSRSEYFTCYVLADGTNIKNITSTGTFELDVTQYNKVRIYYYQIAGWDNVIGTYKLSN